MIPTNSNNLTNCDPISSNCVVWQGPDIPCGNICTGDTISDVVAALCTELQLLQTLVENGGGSSFNIANINQSELIGTPATNLEELIQLMIDNIIINSGNSPGPGTGGDFNCGEVFKCTVTTPPCFRELTGFPSTGSLSDWIGTVSQHLCDLGTVNTTQQALTATLSTKVANLEQQPTGDPNPRIFSSGVTTQGVLTPIETVVQALDAQFITLRNTTGDPANISTGINTQPKDLATPRSAEGYSGVIKASPATSGDAQYNTWLAIDDLRKAVKDIQDNCCANIQLQRMNGINSLYANGTTCSTALSNATANTGCLDIWNTTGVQWDTTVRAYSNPYNPGPNTELVHNQYYALCGGAAIARYSKTAPHWNSIATNCETE
tara:strand:- start:7342 stop:8475 length:1134 start_codon:yes stop_codon:yes gene_type:complete